MEKNKHKHLNESNRHIIESELNKRSSFKRIAELTGKDCTTISKEVRKHRTSEKSGCCGRGFNDCAVAFDRQCTQRNLCPSCTSRNRLCWSCGKCIAFCNSYQEKTCELLTRPPYVCNGCRSHNRCSLEKLYYRASHAEKEYEALRSESRSGFAISEEELLHLDQVVSPLLRNGQSIHHISTHHPDQIMMSERTLYNYVNNGLLSARNIDMPRTVRMRPRKPKPKAFKVDKSCRRGRTFQDYTQFMAQYPDLPVCQCDSVEGIKGSAVLLTIMFVESGLQLAFLRSSNDSQSVIDVFDRLYLELRPDVFMDIFPVLLCDNGSEFSNPTAIEFDRQDNRRTRLYYCDPNAPYQKANCENNHELIRRILPKGVDIGQYSQEQISEMMSHINSYTRKKFGNKSPYDIFAFQHGEEVLKKLGLRKIPPAEIILSPSLLK